MGAGELILYRSEHWREEIQLRVEGDTVWLTKAEMAELFDTTPQATTQHTRAIYEEGELSTKATCKHHILWTVTMRRVPYKTRWQSPRCK